MKYINLVLESSGIQAISYIGAIKYLFECGYTINKIVGTSSGSIIASLIAAGYTPDELEVIVMNTDFQSLIENANIPIEQAIQLLISQNGIYNLDKLEMWLNILLQEKGIYTFEDLQNRGIVKACEIVATDVTISNTLILPQDLIKYNINPLGYPISTCVRMSCSIPYIFTPVVLSLNNEKHYIVDGGLLYSYPINLYDNDANERCRKIPTIGIKMSTELGNSKSSYSSDIVNYTTQLLYTISLNNYVIGSTQKNINRSISIPSMGILPLSFNLTQDDKIKLMQSGYNSAKSFVEINCNNGCD